MFTIKFWIGWCINSLILGKQTFLTGVVNRSNIGGASIWRPENWDVYPSFFRDVYTNLFIGFHQSTQKVLRDYITGLGLILNLLKKFFFNIAINLQLIFGSQSANLSKNELYYKYFSGIQFTVKRITRSTNIFWKK